MSYCNIHHINNCIECAIEKQTQRLELASFASDKMINAMVEVSRRNVSLQWRKYQTDLHHQQFLKLKAISEAKKR